MRQLHQCFNSWPTVAAFACAIAIGWHSVGAATIPVARLQACVGSGFDWQGAETATPLAERRVSGSSYHLLLAEDLLLAIRLQPHQGRCDLAYRDAAGGTRPLSATLPPAVAGHFERQLVKRALAAAGGRAAYQRQLETGSDPLHPLVLAPETVGAFRDLGISLPANSTVESGGQRHV